MKITQAKIVGTRIKCIRKVLNLSQKKFSEILCISQGRLSEIEAGKNFPSFETLLSLNSNFKISLDILLPWTPSEQFSEYVQNVSAQNTYGANNPISDISTTDTMTFTKEEVDLITSLRKLSDSNRSKIEGMIELKLSEAGESNNIHASSSAFKQSAIKKEDTEYGMSS